VPVAERGTIGELSFAPSEVLDAAGAMPLAGVSVREVVEIECPRLL
jgi:hypothetical protein